MDITGFLQAFINGSLLGAVYAGVGIGLSLLLGVLRIVNLAHSAVLIAAALVYWQFVNVLGLDPILAVVPVAVLAYVLGLGLHRGVVQHLQRESDTTVILAFFGVMVLIEAIAIIVWTTDTRTVSVGYLSESLRIGSIGIPYSRIAAAAIIVTLLVILHLFLTRTLTGSAVRGMAQNPDVASMVGIKVGVLGRRVFALGVVLAAVGGAALAMVVSISPQTHARWLAWAFLVVILGGLGSVLRTFLAGLAVGLIETFVGLFLPFQYIYLVLYALLAVTLLVRSEGFSSVKNRTV